MLTAPVLNKVETEIILTALEERLTGLDERQKNGEDTLEVRWHTNEIYLNLCDHYAENCKKFGKREW